MRNSWAALPGGVSQLLVGNQERRFFWRLTDPKVAEQKAIDVILGWRGRGDRLIASWPALSQSGAAWSIVARGRGRDTGDMAIPPPVTLVWRLSQGRLYVQRWIVSIHSLTFGIWAIVPLRQIRLRFIISPFDAYRFDHLDRVCRKTWFRCCGLSPSCCCEGRSLI